METKDLVNFSEISLNCDSKNHSESSSDCDSDSDREQSSVQQTPLKPVDFEEYVRNKCYNKIKILQRSTFHQIHKPIIIFFNHFREKCAYHIKALDKLYQLSLKYGDRIEFIAGDLFDIDILKYKRISIEFFYGDPKTEDNFIFAIDEKKRVHEQNYTKSQSLKNLSRLCENLLKDRLFKSQPLPVTDNSKAVKICVHDNYEELVTNSTKNILLIINHKDYAELKSEEAHKYEAVAKELSPYNVAVVYLNGDKNYIPYELGIVCYTTLVFIPQNDKTNFLCHPTMGPETEENIIQSIKSFLADPKAYVELKNKDLSTNWYVPLNITPDFNIEFEKLPQYLEEYCHEYLKVFERDNFEKTKQNTIIAFMDFKNKKCLEHHLKWIDEIYQVAINLADEREYFIADIQDIQVINSLWKPEDFKMENTKPKVFGIDGDEKKFVLKDFKNAALLFYFAYSLAKGELGEEDMVNC